MGYRDNFIVQPATYDGGKNEDAVGLYRRSLAPDKSTVNDFDAAIAGPLSKEYSQIIPGLNIKADEFTNATIDMKVYKIGMTTGKTFGVITSLTSALKVNNDNEYRISI